MFLRDFYAHASERMRVSEVKQKCFTPQTLRKVENCESVSAIMEILAECYCSPDRFVDEGVRGAPGPRTDQGDKGHTGFR